MRILHIAPIGHHAEGIGSVLQKLVPQQIALGQDVRIISPCDNRIYRELPITTITRKKVFKKFLDSWMPDIVIFHSVFSLKYIAFYNVLKKRNTPYLIQLHGALSFKNYNKNKLKKQVALLLWIKGFIKHAKSIIYLNEAEYGNSIVPKINPGCIIIPNGCVRQDGIDICKSVNDKLNIIFIGRIAYSDKGLDLLIEALRSLEEKKLSGYHVTFYGNEDDIDIDRLKKNIAKMQYVSYGGGVYGEKKDSVLRNADIFLLTSRFEGMPMGVLEAWSYGIPCILTSGTNMASQNQDTNSYWFTTLDSEDIARTIVRAIELYKKNPQRYRKASLEESKKYEWNSIAESSIHIYNEMIQQQYK